MPAPNIAVPRLEFLAKCTRHERIILGLRDNDPGVQKLLAELVLMRLFDEFQYAISEIAYRLASGSNYLDGGTPQLLAPAARSIQGARSLFENYGRSRHQRAKWSKVSYINDTTKFVLDANDTFVQACNSASLEISHMQSIRNRIAHSNSTSRGRFQSVVQRYYGAQLNHVSPGLLLLSPKQSPHLLSRYITACRVVVNACCRA